MDHSNITEVKTKVVSLDEIKVFVLNLPLEQKEQLVSELVDSLPVESKSRTIGSKWTTGGYNFPVNTHLCVQIQNAPNIDIAAIIEAAVMRIRSDREQ